MIGIVGGVGPLAGLDIIGKIIEETQADADQQHLPILLSSQPSRIVDRTAYLLGRQLENPAHAIAAIILELEKGGATLAAIPCHAAHAPRIYEVILEELAKAGSGITLLNMVEETAAYVQAQDQAATIGILESSHTRNTGLYRNALSKYNVQVVEANEQLQEKLDAAIYDPTYGIEAVSAPVSNRSRQEIINAIAELKKAGAQIVILGAAAFTMALPERESDGLPIIDPSRILARALIREFDPQKLRTS